jgi:hypothetical protein
MAGIGKGTHISSFNYQLCVIQISRAPVGIENTSSHDGAALVQLSLELLEYASVIYCLGVPSTDTLVD